MSQSSQVFFQLEPRSTGSPIGNNSQVIITPYPSNSCTDGYKRPEIKHGTATFVLDPMHARHHLQVDGDRTTDLNINHMTNDIPIGNYENSLRAKGISSMPNGGPQIMRNGYENIIAKDTCQRDVDDVSDKAGGVVSDVNPPKPSKAEVSSVDIVLGPRGSNLVDIKSEINGGESNSGPINKERYINLSFNNNAQGGNGPWFSTEPKLLSVEAVPPGSRGMINNKSHVISHVPVGSHVNPERRIRNQTGVINVRTVVAPQNQDPLQQSPELNGSQMPSLSLSHSKTSNTNSNIGNPLPVYGNNSGEVRGHLSLAPNHMQQASLQPPTINIIPSESSPESISAQRMPTVISGSHHFRFSPSLMRRPCRLSTVHEAPVNSQNGLDHSDEDEEVGGNDIDYTDGDSAEVGRKGAIKDRQRARQTGSVAAMSPTPPPKHKETAHEKFTSTVNFRLDRERGEGGIPALLDTDSQWRVGGSPTSPPQWKRRWPRTTVDIADSNYAKGESVLNSSRNADIARPSTNRLQGQISPFGRSQESKVLQTELDLAVVREQLPPPTLPDSFRLRPSPSSDIPSKPTATTKSRTETSEETIVKPRSTRIDCDNPGENDRPPTPPSQPPPEEDPDDEQIADDLLPEAYDPRRRASYRISCISDDGFRAWTQNRPASSSSSSPYGHNGVGGLHYSSDAIITNNVVDNASDDDSEPYMDKLKNIAARLKLATRRASTQAWRDRVVGKPAATWRYDDDDGDDANDSSPNFTSGKKKSSLHDFGDVQDESEQNQWSLERLDRVNEALSWLRRELLYMREQDQTLARYLITLRHDIQQVKLARSSAEHQEAIEDAADVLEEARHLAGHSDVPPEHFSTPLKQYGVTRMNINRRRFSVF